MKKSYNVLILGLVSLMLAGCDGGGNKPGTSSTYEFKTFNGEFDEDYLPNLDSVNQDLQGSLKIALVFEGKQDGWRAVADEYEKIHDNAVSIDLVTNHTAEDYSIAVQNELNKSDPGWDIVQGNLISGSFSKENYIVALNSAMYETNPYANDEVWADVLYSDAYDTNKSDPNAAYYILNSENLQTAWFINRVALGKAAEKGYQTLDSKGAPLLADDGLPLNPRTWDELVSLCSKMVEAGYPNPLGLSLNDTSIKASQFSWLLRVYGDYYYRNEYSVITNEYGRYTVDLTASNPEATFGFKKSSLFNTILYYNDGENPRYVGAKSDKFADFVGQFQKVAPYVNHFNSGKTFEVLREEFRLQSYGNESPQIMLDYTGTGLKHLASENSNFQVDFFDHPKMVSSYVDPTTLLRDVGGNGGYLSIVQHRTRRSQETLALDFLKFFMSPYGQSIFYEKLKEKNAYPQGMTLVDNDLVVIPEEWKSFFNSGKTTFAGLADANPYLTYFIRGMGTAANVSKEKMSLWTSLVTPYGTAVINDIYTDFQVPWHDALMADWSKCAQLEKVDEDIYKEFNGNK